MSYRKRDDYMITYRFYAKGNDTLMMTDWRSRIPIVYFSKQKMEELYPDGGYVVIGEIGNYAKTYAEQDVILTDMGKSIPIFPRGTLKKPIEWVVGYAVVGGKHLCSSDKEHYTAIDL